MHDYINLIYMNINCLFYPFKEKLGNICWTMIAAYIDLFLPFI